MKAMLMQLAAARRTLLVAGLGAVLTSSLAACSKKHDDDTASPSLIQPTRSKPAFGPDIQDQMQAVVEQFMDFNDPQLPTLSARQARMTHSVTDAVNAQLSKFNLVAPIANVTVRQVVLDKAYTPGSAPDGVPVRVYTPAGATGTLPGIVYYHGGGWVIGSLDVYEPSAMALAERTGAVVVSVDYRLASETENKFPAAHEDAYAAYKWVREKGSSLGINPAKVAVAGESAGGNMACAVSILAGQRGIALPTHQLLVYPVANNDLTTSSYQQYANAVPLNKANVEYFTSLYFNSPADGDSPLISLVDVADQQGLLKGLPATTIIGAEIDPLQTEGKQLADRLTANGVSVQYMLYPGTTHEFFGTYAVVPPANDAQNLAAARLKDALK